MTEKYRWFVFVIENENSAEGYGYYELFSSKDFALEYANNLIDENIAYVGYLTHKTVLCRQIESLEEDCDEEET